jgi:transcriptional regulator with XRE-family HTH domain
MDPKSKPTVTLAAPVKRRKNPLNQFGRLVRSRRRELDLTLEDLSQATGLHLSTLSLVESGRRLPPELSHVLSLASGLRLPPGTPGHEEFVKLAYAERAQARQRTVKAGTLRRVVRIGEAVATPPAPDSGRPPDPALAAWHEALKQLLDLQTQSGIREIRVLTVDGREFVVRLQAPEG